ncbi:MAG: hypothetical protein FJ279_30740 [Planctomycetes bacterium]|nr:hypothetical protein [Planctomycetota bacterium]
MGQKASLSQKLEPLLDVPTADEARLRELAAAGLEHRVRENHARYRRGEISFGRFAEELGFNAWELTHILEEMGLPTTNLPG